MTSAPELEQQDQLCLITGATNGVGRAAAFALARLGLHVLVHGRAADRVQRVVEAIRTEGYKASPLVADLASLSAVRRLAREVLDTAGSLRLVVLNAAIWPDQRLESADGYELTLQVNYLSHYLLSRLILERMLADAPARVLIMSSVAHQGGALDFEDLQLTRNFRGDQAYANSKLAQVMFCASLAQRVAGSGVTVHSLCPGLVDTGLIAHNRDFDAMRGRLRARMSSPEEGAKLLIHLATAPEVSDMNGCFFSRSMTGGKPMPIKPPPGLAEALWAKSEELTDVYNSQDY
jgi:retinol dehydrogenase 12